MKKENFCKDCKWCKNEGWPICKKYVCKKYILDTDLVTGKIYYGPCRNIRPKCNDWERGGIIGDFKRLVKKIKLWKKEK